MTPLSVLIVDGSPETRRALAIRLSGTGGDPAPVVHEAATGAEGIAAARRLRPDCVLLGETLPDMDGLEVLRALHDASGDPQVPVVLLTEAGGEARAVAAMKEGAQDYIDRNRTDREALVRSIRVATDRFALLRSRQEALAALRESEDRLRRREAELARAHRLGRSGGHVVHLRDGEFTNRRSPEYLAIHGLPPEAAGETHDDWVRRIHPEDRERTEKAFLQAIATAQTEYAIDYRIIRPSDGALRWISVLAEIERDAEGRPLRLFGTHTDITERKLAEERLRENEERVRLALEAVNGIIYDWDLRTGQVSRGGQVRQITGYDIADIPPDPAWWDARLHPDDLPRLQQEARAAIDARQERIEADYRLRHHDGHWIHLSDRTLVVYGPDGPVRAIGSTIDITARKQAEAALRESESRFRAVFENAGVGVGCVDLFTMQCLDVNDALCTMLGYTREELMGLPWPDITHPDDVEPDLQRFQRMARGEIDRYTVEKRYIHKDGRLVWARLAVSLVRAANGAPSFEIAIVEDITEQKQAEAALRLSEERFRRVIDTNILPFGIGTADGGISYVNDAFLGLVDQDREAFLSGRINWRDLTPPEYRDVDDAKQHELRRNGSAAPYEKEYLLEDGRRIPVLVAMTQAGQDDEHVAVIVDLSARKAAESALARSNEMLEARIAERTRALSATAEELAAEMKRREKVQTELLQAQKLEALGQLTGGIAHDFNNVLAAVLGTYRLIARRTRDEGILDLLRHGEAAAERGSSLVRQLMAFARREQLAPTLVEPARLLPQIESLIGHATGSGIMVEVEIEDGTGPIRVDPHQLEVALVNLAANARDAMPEGGRLRLMVRNRPGPAGWEGASDSYVEFAVQDTGAGMPPEVLARAVDPFFTTKEPGKGTGLGLAMVHGFAEQSGGTLRIDSRPGQGTTVTIRLPRAHAATAGRPVARRSGGQHGNAVLMLVDDDEDLRAVTAAHLRDLGYHVLEAPGGQAALDLGRGGPAPDLVVTDVVMPGMDGVALAVRLRAERPDLPILFMTAHAGTRALAGEVVLRKPFTEADLSDRILEMLGRGKDGEDADGTVRAERPPQGAGA
ncbi:PAS domain S-box protein [Rubellimicrobium arenae]|uniref:PAS domain S-box protein n=1 Tax=Rubellimicrobium arenae TaxID=2817372 RepID=UPI001B310B45|nr:PAS domain S-box protein [Rubellimicrobium arenae]